VQRRFVPDETIRVKSNRMLEALKEEMAVRRFLQVNNLICEHGV
jgi:hypothetical protein